MAYRITRMDDSLDRWLQGGTLDGIQPPCEDLGGPGHEHPCQKGDTDDIAEPGGQPGIESEPLHGRPEEARQQHDHGEQHEEDDHRRLPVGRDLSGVPVEANDRAERRVAGIGHEIRRQLLAQPG